MELLARELRRENITVPVKPELVVEVGANELLESRTSARRPSVVDNA